MRAAVARLQESEARLGERAVQLAEELQSCSEQKEELQQRLEQDPGHQVEGERAGEREEGDGASLVDEVPPCPAPASPAPLPASLDELAQHTTLLSCRPVSDQFQRRLLRTAFPVRWLAATLMAEQGY